MRKLLLLLLPPPPFVRQQRARSLACALTGLSMATPSPGIAVRYLRSFFFFASSVFISQWSTVGPGGPWLAAPAVLAALGWLADRPVACLLHTPTVSYKCFAYVTLSCPIGVKWAIHLAAEHRLLGRYAHPRRAGLRLICRCRLVSPAPYFRVRACFFLMRLCGIIHSMHVYACHAYSPAWVWVGVSASAEGQPWRSADHGAMRGISVALSFIV